MQASGDSKATTTSIAAADRVHAILAKAMEIARRTSYGENVKRKLGICYYPEQWPASRWREDACRMADAGLTWVRMGEFSWSLIEPRPGKAHWAWLDEAIEIVGQTGLQVILGTPTAAPPHWLIAKHPDMLAVDAAGRPRKFGSRRHYCFSHPGYLAECRRIVTAMAERYGANPYVHAWQTDNEYGCHDTTLSYSAAARRAFCQWLREQFPAATGDGGDIAALNRAWGNVFWSMNYEDFEAIDLPNLTVTEANPAHCLAFRRFSCGQVVKFNRAQVEIIRRYSAAPITHNYMGRSSDFDHFRLGEDLDIASWDSYPLGFLEDRIATDDAERRRYARQGEPDFQAFHHDLYRGVGRGRWWVMEQQPGAVNWASYNPSPLPGIVRLWTWEAFAHGAETVCYFRWRQSPFAQEQMHAGLLRSDSVETPAMAEVREVFAELAEASAVSAAQAEIALIFDYDADAAWRVQPHGQGLSYFQLLFDYYRALRKLGLSIDIVAPTERSFKGYRLVFAPGMIHMPADLKQALFACRGMVVLGPRSAARDAHMAIPLPLPPAMPGLDVTVSRVESLRPDMPIAVREGGHVTGYLEELASRACDVLLHRESDAPLAVRDGERIYIGGWLDQEGLVALFRCLCREKGVATLDLPDGVRIRDTACERFWFNYNPHPLACHGRHLPVAGVIRERRANAGSGS